MRNFGSADAFAIAIKIQKSLSPYRGKRALIDEQRFSIRKRTPMKRSLATNPKKRMKDIQTPKTTFIGIAAIVGGTCLVVTAMIAIFSPENLAAAPWIAGSLSAMGVALGYFSTLPTK